LVYYNTKQDNSLINKNRKITNLSEKNKKNDKNKTVTNSAQKVQFYALIKQA